MSLFMSIALTGDSQFSSMAWLLIDDTETQHMIHSLA